MPDPDMPRTLQTSSNTLAIVNEIKRLDGARLSELADQLDLSRSTVHVHLQTLLDRRFIVKHGNEYRIGFKFFHLGEYARHQDPRYGLGREKVKRLAERTTEEANFVVEDHGRTIILFAAVSTPHEEGFQIGQYFYMHNTASGKAMLSQYSDKRINAILDEWGLPRETEHTITDRDELFKEIERTRERGYAVNRQEALEGLRAIAVPVLTPNGSVFASIDIYGPSYRLAPDEELAAAIQAEVDDLEEEISSYGYF